MARKKDLTILTPPNGLKEAPPSLPSPDLTHAVPLHPLGGTNVHLGTVCAPRCGTGTLICKGASEESQFAEGAATELRPHEADAQLCM